MTLSLLFPDGVNKFHCKNEREAFLALPVS